MAMTATQKILARHAGLERVEAGQLIEARLDLVLGNDITAPLAIIEFEKLGATRVFDPERVLLVADHFVPNKDIKSAMQSKRQRDFARAHQLPHYYEGGDGGIEHALLPERGLTRPGMLIIGADSHTCTYGALGAFSTGVGSTDLAVAMATGKAWFKVPAAIRVVYRGKLRPWVGGKDLILHTIGRLGVEGANYRTLELTGEALAQVSVEGRLTMANMGIEAGAKNAFMEPDQATLAWVDARTDVPYEVVRSDHDAPFEATLEIDVGQVEPQVALPHLPENARGVSQVGDVAVDQVVIGSCTNGRLEDLRVAAKILAGKKVHPWVRLIVIPATQAIYRQALEEGLLKVFVDAGGIVSTPTCGPCLGGHMGVLAEGERALATTNRNFVGRMGHPKSEVYLAGPAVAAATAVRGRISSPEEVA